MPSVCPSHLFLISNLGIIDAHKYMFKTSHWPDHITGPTLERMLLHLIKNESNDQITFHYRVCVYSKAFFFLMKSDQSQHNSLTGQRLKESQREYKRVALASLGRLTFLSPPCLSLVQALLSGVGAATCFFLGQTDLLGHVDAILGKHVL